MRLSVSLFCLSLSVSTHATYTQQGACILDSDTNALWEGKTKDGTLHDSTFTYSWFDSTSSSSNKGYESQGKCLTNGQCDTEKYLRAVNAEKYCGMDNWRLPTRVELNNLVKCPNGRETDNLAKGYPCKGWLDNTQGPYIDPIFKNTDRSFYWSSESYDILPEYAWYGYFWMGSIDRTFKSETRSIRLISPNYTAPSPTPAPKIVCNNYPLWDAVNSILTIPKFDKASPVCSAKLKFDFNTNTFIVLNYITC